MRKQSAYARKRARQHHDRLAPFRLLDRARPYDEGDLTDEHIKTRAAFDALREGTGTEDDFYRVSMVLNVALIRAEQIDAQLVEIVQKAQAAMVRMQDRSRRGLKLGFDADGLQTVPPALDANEAMMDASSPLQLKMAIREAYRRISGGDVLRMTA